MKHQQIKAEFQITSADLNAVRKAYHDGLNDLVFYTEEYPTDENEAAFKAFSASPDILTALAKNKLLQRLPEDHEEFKKALISVHRDVVLELVAQTALQKRPEGFNEKEAEDHILDVFTAVHRAIIKGLDQKFWPGEVGRKARTTIIQARRAGSGKRFAAT